MSELELAVMRAEDLEQVLAIERSACLSPWTETLFMDEIRSPDGAPRVALLQGSIAGYLCARQTLDEAHILNLAVHLAFRRRGVASALVRDAILHFSAKSCRFLFLEVRITNEPAKAIYGKFGFLEIGIRKAYYRDPIEDAIVMRKSLA